MHTPPTFAPEEIAKEISSEKSHSDCAPACTLATSYLNKHPVDVAMMALVDSGSNFSLVHRSKSPAGCIPARVPVQNAHAAAGSFTFSSVVVLEDAHSPEFSRSLRIEKMVACVFDAPCRRDVIIGRNWMIPNKFNIVFETKMMTWFGREVPDETFSDSRNVSCQ